MRKPIIAGNWKMNKLREEAVSFCETFTRKLPHHVVGKLDVVICPSFVHLPVLTAKGALPAGIMVGAQDNHWESKGAFTGSVSTEQLKDLKVRHVIVGHSERRRDFQESPAMLAGKLKSALKNSLIPIYCVGERLEEREKGKTFQVLEAQMEALKEIPAPLVSDPSNFVLAYEPVWAIGTGKNATPEQAQEAHQFLRALIGKHWSPAQAQETRILYGGSVTPDNLGALFKCPDLDGGLVGGASLEAESLIKLIQIAIEA